MSVGGNSVSPGFVFFVDSSPALSFLGRAALAVCRIANSRTQDNKTTNFHTDFLLSIHYD
jgi:hypothetical protein